MASDGSYRPPMVESVVGSFDLSQEDYGQKSDSETQFYSRSRNSSNARGYTQPLPVPVDDAVSHAFSRSDAANQVDAALVAQITEQVINTLKATGITGVQQPQPQRQQPSNLRSRSPTDSTTASLPGRYTPPSPTRNDTTSHRSSSPEPLQMSESTSYSSSYDMPRPMRNSGNASPSRAASDDLRSRPRQVRIPSAVEETSTLEKIWQPLFIQGQPTPRLSQFLRGLALHIIDDYEPKRSLVITPAKMVQFFDQVRLSNETYPWRDIFGGRITNESISRMYRDLRCQHHFVQIGPHSAPEIPALTPDGFDCFMTILIRAHPTSEFERLAKALLDMPISNADDSKERFPKELSRRLLPAEDDVHQQQRLHAAMSADRNIRIRSSNPMPPPPPQTQPPPFSQPPQSTMRSERERAPYSGLSVMVDDDLRSRSGNPMPPPTLQTHPSAFAQLSQSTTLPERERAPYSSLSVVDDDDLRTAPPKIERERQPYTAKEGSGKIYEDDRKRSEPSTRSSRANSAAPTQPFAQSSRPTDIPTTGQRSHRLSTSGQRPTYLGTSPPTANYSANPYSRSEGTNVGSVPASYYASNLHAAEEDRNRYSRREEDARRGSWYQNSGQDYGNSGYDDRRRSGTDGYGSYGGGGGGGGGYPPTSRY